jgi:hypothetical protein
MKHLRMHLNITLAVQTDATSMVYRQPLKMLKISLLVKCHYYLLIEHILIKIQIAQHSPCRVHYSTHNSTLFLSTGFR